MLILEDQTCTLQSLNLRTEKHGEDSVQAADLKLTFKTANTILDQLAPGLRASLYMRPPKDDELFETPDHMPFLRWPALQTYQWELEVVGRKVTIAFGLGEDSAIVLPDCKINKLRFLTMMGGTVEVTFRVQCIPESADVAKLFTLLDGECDVTLDMSPTLESEATVIDGTERLPEAPAQTPRLDDDLAKEATQRERPAAGKRGKKPAPGIGPDDPAWPFGKLPAEGTGALQ